MIRPALATAAAILMVVLALAVVLAGYRMIKGPGYADRFVALDMLTAVAVAFLSDGPTARAGVALKASAATVAASVVMRRNLLIGSFPTWISKSGWPNTVTRGFTN